MESCVEHIEKQVAWPVNDEQLDEYTVDGTENLGVIIERLNKILPVSCCKKLKLKISVGLNKFKMSYPAEGSHGVGSGLDKLAQDVVMKKMVTINCWRARTEKYKRSTFGDDAKAMDNWNIATKQWGFHMDGFDHASEVLYHECDILQQAMSMDRFIVARGILRWILDKRVRLFVDNRRQEVQKAGGISERNNAKCPVAYDMATWVRVDNIQAARVVPPQKPRFTTEKLVDMHKRSVESIGVPGSSSIINSIFDVYSSPSTAEESSDNDDDDESCNDGIVARGISRAEKIAALRKANLETLLELTFIKLGEVMEQSHLAMSVKASQALTAHLKNPWIQNWSRESVESSTPKAITNREVAITSALSQPNENGDLSLANNPRDEMQSSIVNSTADLSLTISPSKRPLSPPPSSPSKTISDENRDDESPSKKRRIETSSVSEYTSTEDDSACSSYDEAAGRNILRNASSDAQDHNKPSPVVGEILPRRSTRNRKQMI